MSVWSCEDFDVTTTQSISIPKLTYLSSFRFKVIKSGTINTNAVFRVRILNGAVELFSETFTAAQVNANSGNGVRMDISMDCANLLLTQNADGTAHTYTIEFSATNYTSTATSRLMLCRREFGDEVYTISNLPTGFTNNETASAYPIFMEFFTLQG